MLKTFGTEGFVGDFLLVKVRFRVFSDGGLKKLVLTLFFGVDKVFFDRISFDLEMRRPFGS